MDSHNSTSNASKHATGKRKADTLTDVVNDGGAGPSVCCPCVHCDRQCECHEVDEATYLDSLPIGYRFNPTDKELITHYLVKKIRNEKLPKNKINEAYIYGDYHPKDFVVNYPQAVEGEWYFFTSRTRKYVNGTRPSRTAGSGYWKATGPDKDIKHNETKIGGKKSLVYHVGRSPKGAKTEWVMHEYVATGYERKRSNLQDMKLDDYVLCKIYTTKRDNGKETNEEGVSDQQPREENIVTEAREHVMAPDQQARVVSNQDINPTGENNNVFRSNQSFSSTIPHVENSAPSMGRQVMILDQQARVVSNQDINPSRFQVENNKVVRSNPSSISTIRHVENSSPSMGRQVMVPDQLARPTISFQYENNLDQHMGTLNNLMGPYSRSLQPIQRTGFPKLRAPPLMHDYSVTPFNNNYSLPNNSYFPPTPRRSPPLPPNNAHEYVHVNPVMYQPGPSSNPRSPAFQESIDGDENSLLLDANIKNMFSQDGNGSLLDDIYSLSFDGNEQLDFDESKKKHGGLH